MIDSGADYCVFNISFGDALKIDFTKIRPEIIRGVNNIPTDIYYEDVELIIRSNSIKIRCGFLKDLKINVLGQDGIFDKYKVNFFYNDKYFEMIPSSKI